MNPTASGDLRIKPRQTRLLSLPPSYISQREALVRSKRTPAKKPLGAIVAILSFGVALGGVFLFQSKILEQALVRRWHGLSETLLRFNPDLASKVSDDCQIPLLVFAAQRGDGPMVAERWRHLTSAEFAFDSEAQATLYHYEAAREAYQAAQAKGYEAIIQLLLDAGADSDEALRVAGDKNDLPLARIALDCGAGRRLLKDRAFLENLISKNYLQMLRLVVRSGAPLDALDPAFREQVQRLTFDKNP
jgi:hypothetical protein